MGEDVWRKKKSAYLKDCLHVIDNDEQSPLQLLFKEVLNVSSNIAGFARDLNQDNGNWMSNLPIFVLVFTSYLYMFRAIQVYVA